MSSILADQYSSALVYEPKCGMGRAGVAGSHPMSTGTAVFRSPNKLRDITPYLTYVADTPILSGQDKICNWGTVGDRLNV